MHDVNLDYAEVTISRGFETPKIKRFYRAVLLEPPIGGDLQCTPYPLSSFSWLFAWPQKEPTDAWVARKSFIFPTRKITLTKFTSFFIKINIPSPIKSQFSGVHQIAIFRYHPVQASFVATIITSVPLLWTSSFMCTYVMLILNNRCLQNPC